MSYYYYRTSASTSSDCFSNISDTTTDTSYTIEGITTVRLDYGCYKKVRGDNIAYYDINGRYHREDGPAYIEPNYKVWYIHGKRHREDGPAYISKINGKRCEKYYLNGILCSEEDVKIKKILSIKEVNEIIDELMEV